MTIYLYKKTHNKTGLKYLGKTNNPYPHTYKGSGHYWKRHINTHGYDVTTEILLETDDPEKIKEMGIYYSNLWNVVESEEWANLKPEMGDGGDPGPEGRRKTAEKLIGVKHDDARNERKSKRQSGKPKSKEWLEKRIGSTYKKHKEWEYTGKNHWNSDQTIYTFENIKTGERVQMIRSEFKKMINAPSSLNKMINGNPKYKTVKGWRLVKD
jgi:hypothetical protein